ncbi:RHS repeat-associated core domain-containing protein [Pseudomonas putida]|jgi:uncharacterized protein RhaS with RHS repeats
MTPFFTIATDPRTARFISKDPVVLDGEINTYQYAPNPRQWIDPLELTRTANPCSAKDKRK